MPRRGYKKQQSGVDAIYQSREVAKLINYIMHDGEKTVASKLVYKALDQIKSRNLDPLNVLRQAIANVAPRFEVKPKRIGGASYLVPTETLPTRKLFLSLAWIIEGARSRSNKEFHTFDKKLATELLEAFENKGKAIEKKMQVEKLAEANRAFAHFRW